MSKKKTQWEIEKFYNEATINDLEYINIKDSNLIPRVTDHIPEMIKFVEGLIEKGYGYETNDGIYFDISKFSGYGKLSGINLEEQQAGARVEINEDKRHPADFALWKKAPK